MYDAELAKGLIAMPATPDGGLSNTSNAMSVAPQAPAGTAPTVKADGVLDPIEDAGQPGDAASCGDGVVNGVEKCDLGIEAGQPGACPDECGPLGLCIPRVKNGDGCQAECVLRELACESGDGCCPGKCTKDNDGDCAGRCGDGIIQESSGETCEAESDQPCKTSTEQCDDGDPCTRDSLGGSPETCTAACAHTPLAPELAADGCCPGTGNANIDRDCSARCGNDVVEEGEECDGAPGCDATCKDVARAERMRCMAAATTPCEQCACTMCARTELACLMGPDAQANQLCKAVLTCSQASGCLGTNCYCGSLGCGLSFGPCREPIEAAVGGDISALTRDANDPNTTIGRAYTADMCRVTSCQSVCRAAPPAR